ncbi:hypothetical protein [Gelidibacter salicanalis]|uniref:Uncharacterized protein n=1 Tax=Gelidibacter salicanalis TaxID=291193 RepID=A0A934KWB8_9FLAO|nr:hypothetical protein [Gelidibacter salicanalis]MBJ7880555.1 hypothetical protein [Gelidibacter salicanalis]
MAVWKTPTLASRLYSKSYFHAVVRVFHQQLFLHQKSYFILNLERNLSYKYLSETKTMLVKNTNIGSLENTNIGI